MQTFQPIIKTAVAAVSFIVLAMPAASAAPRGHHFENTHASVNLVNVRIANQARRIARARAAGRINWIEARHAQFELSQSRGFRATYLRDGWLNRYEVRHLDMLLNRNAYRIARFAGNGWRGHAGLPGGRRHLSRLNGF